MADIYYDPVVHDAQLLYLVARHFPKRLSAVPPTVLEGIGSAVSGNRVSSLSAAYTLLALDAYANVATRTGKLGMSEIAKDGKEKVLTLPGRSDAEGQRRRRPRPNCNSARKDRCRPTMSSTNPASSGTCRPPEINQGVEIIREFLDLKEQPDHAGESRRRVPGAPATARAPNATACRNSRWSTCCRRRGSRARTASARRQQRARRGSRDYAEPPPQHCPSDCPTSPTGRRNMSTSATTAWCSTAMPPRMPGTFVYRVRATNAGVFQSPPAFAEGMYDRTVTGLGLAGKLEIVKP